MSFARSPDAHLTAALNRGIDLFNDGEYFEAHEVWEDWWQDEVGPPRQFVQGLIQVAAALHKCIEGTPSGTAKLMDQALRHLEPFRPVAFGIDVEDLVTGCRSWRDLALQMLREGVTLRPDRPFPVLRAATPVAAGNA